MIVQQGVALGGSGSTYMYAYVDATYKDNMTKEECYNFVSKGKCSFYCSWGIVKKLKVMSKFIAHMLWYS